MIDEITREITVQEKKVDAINKSLEDHVRQIAILRTDRSERRARIATLRKSLKK